MALPNPAAGDSVAAAHIDSIRTHLEGASGDTTPYKLRQSTGDFIVVLADNAGASELSIHDSDDVEVAHIDSNGAATFNTVAFTNLDIPVSASPSQTADGRVVWDSDDNLLTIGDGVSRQTFYPGLGVALRNVITRKAADETVNNSATLQNDDHFSLTVASGETWYVRLKLYMTGSAGGQGLRMAFTFPATSLAQAGRHLTGTVAGAATFAQLAPAALTTGTSFVNDGAGYTSGAYEITAFFTFTAGGTLQYQWAQDTANASDTKVLVGSIMQSWRIS